MKKKLPKIKLLLILFTSLFFLSNCSSTKNPSSYKGDVSASDIKNMVDSHNFLFVAESVNPIRGRYRNLTSRYDVRVSSDSVISYLPYFGRAFTAPIDPSKGGIQFTSTDFSYDVSHDKSDKWNITIKPRGQDVRQMNFSVFENGSASLSVTSNSREPISFNGHLQKQ